MSYTVSKKHDKVSVTAFIRFLRFRAAPHGARRESPEGGASLDWDAVSCHLPRADDPLIRDAGALLL